MPRILVIDDTPFWRDLAAEALRSRGYEVCVAAEGFDGLTQLRSHGVDLVILDVEMPHMEGFTFLEHVRREEKWKHLPVIMLTGAMRKEAIVRAKSLGAAAYLLKSNFSLDEMLQRVQKQLTAPPSSHSSETSSSSDAAHPADIRQLPILLKRDASIQRAQNSSGGNALSGVVAEVISMASSSRGDSKELAAMIGRDPVLSARVLQLANSANYITAHGAVSNIPDALRIVGNTAVRNLAAAVGVFDAIAAGNFDNFDPIRYWQHSFAVATLCGRVAKPDDSAQAYLVGLCHHLGDILFSAHFGSEYHAILEMHQSTHFALPDIEHHALGATRSELVGVILKSLELPEAIHAPIQEYLDIGPRRFEGRPLTRVLRICDLHANAIGLGVTDESLVGPLLAANVRESVGQENPPRPDAVALRGEILALTTLLARLGPAEIARLSHAGIQGPMKIWLARDPAYSDFDPVQCALESLAAVSVSDHIPAPPQLADHAALIILARHGSVSGFTARDIVDFFGREKVLWLLGRFDAHANQPNDAKHLLHPLPLDQLSAFVNQCTEE